MPEAGVDRAAAPLVIGRYAMFQEIASGGMATVHLGCVLDGADRGQTCAIKRLRSTYVKDEDFLTMFLDEARIVARIRHPNVVATNDVVKSAAGMFLVMEYVHGETLSRLLRTTRAKHGRIPASISARVVHDVLLGLHAAHETRSESGVMLDVVHRDVSPQNVMVSVDGMSRVLDFGVAKAVGRAQVTREGQIKGKLAYMAPEQVRGQVDRRTDVFAAAVVLWEALAGRRLHEGLKDFEIVSRVMKGALPKPSAFAEDVAPALDAVVMRGLSSDPGKRFAAADAFAREIAAAVDLAPRDAVGEWLEELVRETLVSRSERVAAMTTAAESLEPSADAESLLAKLTASSGTMGAGASRGAGEVEIDVDAPVRGAPFGIVTTPTAHFPPPGAGIVPPPSSPSLTTKTEPLAFAPLTPLTEVRPSVPGPPAPRAFASSPSPRHVVVLAVSVTIFLLGAALVIYALVRASRHPPSLRTPATPSAIVAP